MITVLDVLLEAATVVFFLGVGGLFAGIGVFLFFLLVKIKTHGEEQAGEKECPCDKCKHLKFKIEENKRYWRYQCECFEHGFDTPPEYCSHFKERETNVAIPKKEESPKRNDNKMRTLEQIDRDIAFVRYDIKQLRKMHSPISVAADDLLELYDERRRVVEAMKEKGETAL